VSSYGATGATNPAQDISSRYRVADTSSRITFAAQEDLGGGAKAGVYCETGINIDNGSFYGQADTANANTTTFCSREGRLYIGNSTGEIRLGRQNVWWTQGDLNQIGSNMVGKDVFTDLFTGGVGQYTTRGENMVKLVAGPTFGAFAGSEVYSGFMGRSGMDMYSTQSTGEGSINSDGKYSGFKVNYSQGQILGMIDYQTSKNSATSQTTLFGDAAGTAAAAGAGYNRTASKYGVGYKYGGESLVSFQYYSKERTKVAAGSATEKDGGYGITLHHDAGSGYVLVAQYAKADKRSYSDATAQTENGATAYTLGGIKRLSKRTHLYTAYNVINNGAAGVYNLSGGNYASANGVGAGAQVKTLSLGFQHWF
jgi:predicted porin